MPRWTGVVFALRIAGGLAFPVTVATELLGAVLLLISAGVMACHRLPDFVAARSSAVDEDGAVASFAGQHKSYLNITGADDTLQAVTRCWESARSERALEYRRQQGLSVEHVRLAGWCSSWWLRMSPPPGFGSPAAVGQWPIGSNLTNRIEIAA